MEIFCDVFECCSKKKSTDNQTTRSINEKKYLFIYLITSIETSSNKVKQNSWILADPNRQFNIELKKEISFKKIACTDFVQCTMYTPTTHEKRVRTKQHKNNDGEINI